jgi:K+/H+ antiporter YhaU regulatory subunit KhtT
MREEKFQTTPPQYLQIAQDLATRISKGKLEEGSTLYGRSVMSSEYNVSPETIRRALRLLADMKVVDIKPQSRTVVLSRDNAKRYLHNFSDAKQWHSLQTELKNIVEQSEEMQHRLTKIVGAVIATKQTFLAAGGPVPTYEVVVPADSHVLGKNLVELKFWQATGGTIVAIRRGQNVILSPGPYAELYEGDILVIVGEAAVLAAAKKFIRKKR